ncbi:MAG: hypothetical protein O7A98_01520 [Acidobacteria bacterium]|nr:hypothetical protein [Acidobacteriota bacterium]MCZ6726016.1 hypothetical protein [Acidobacteriota bacterium]
MSLMAYKVLHIFSVILTFTVVGGLALHVANGGNKESNRQSKLTGILHGVGLLLILVSGFGALARLGAGFPGWVWAKIAIWLTLGAAAALVRSSPALSRALLLLLPLLGGVAAWLAFYKPF